MATNDIRRHGSEGHTQRRGLAGHALLGLLLVTCAFAVGPEHADAARELVPRDCVADEGDSAGCGVNQQGLDGASKLALSPDGASLYVASAEDDAIVHLQRDAATGELTPRGCISDVGDPAGCGVTQQGLDGANDVAVSPDGLSVYAVSRWDDAIVQFERDPATGGLAPKGCIADVPDLAGCGVEQQGLSGPVGILGRGMTVNVSPDGRFVYVLSPGLTSTEWARDPQPGEENSNAPAISRFVRNTDSGQLAPDGCISTFPRTPPHCEVTDTQGLEVAGDFAISPDGTSMYVAAAMGYEHTPPAVSRFAVDKASGELSFQECIADESETLGQTNCQTRREGIGPSALAISPDGASVYNGGGGGLVQFSRGTDGTITYEGCIGDPREPSGCETSQEGLAPFGVEDMAVAPDGMSLYTVGWGRIWRLLRDLDGALSPQGCVGEAGPVCTPGGETFAGASGVAVGPDSASVYVASEERDTVVHLRLAPDTTITSGPSGTTSNASPSFGFTSSEAGSSFQCRLDGGAWSACSSPKSYSNRPDGRHVFAVRATDPANNTDPSPATRTFTVDTKVKGSASAKKKQKQKGKKIVVKPKVKAREDLSARATGKVKLRKKTYKLKPQSKSVASGEKKTLKLKPKKRKHAKKIAKALKRGKKATAKVKVRLADVARNTVTDKLKVRLVR